YRRVVWRHAVVAPVRGALEIAGAAADERARDDAPDPERIKQLAGDLTGAVQALQAEGVLMGGDLEHAVGGGVTNGLQGAQVTLAERVDDGRSRRMAIAQDARKIGAPAQLGDDVRREARRGGREVAPLEGDWCACDFPMARLRILAGRDLQDRKSTRL